MSAPRCPKPEKIAYGTQLAAEDARLRINACNGTPQRLSRAYECRCGYWHLTKWEYVAPKGRERTRHLTVAPEPAAFEPSDPISPKRRAHWAAMEAERTRANLANPWPWKKAAA
jgi:hypothetical protein